jgi:pimeloyl-ACP methyl ester carboxylesterase
MKKRRLMKTFTIVGIILLIWVVFAQSCMKFRTSDANAKADFEKAGVTLNINTLKINKHRLHYAGTGSDTLPTIVFIHGSPGSWDAFTQYMKDKDLLQHFRMVSIDRPGFGYSDFGDAAHLDVQAQIISPLLKQLANNKPMYLAGHSLGGPMIVKLAADNPGLVSALVMLAGSVDPKEEKREGWRKILAYSPLYFLVPGAMRPSNMELLYFKKDVLPLQDDFAKITCPVYIIHGEIDPLVPPGNAAHAKAMLVNAKKVVVHMLPGANHFIPWTRYNSIKTLLLELDK